MAAVWGFIVNNAHACGCGGCDRALDAWYVPTVIGAHCEDAESTRQLYFCKYVNGFLRIVCGLIAAEVTV
jgi:hypothetical protein